MIGELSRAAEKCVSHEQMADHPFRFGPQLVVPLDSERVDVEVEAGLQVGRVHAVEPPQVALDSQPEAVDELHDLEICGSAHVAL